LLQYNHLLGRNFDFDHNNCYQLVREFYRDNYQIELSDYACPTEFWNQGLDLYSSMATQEGFTALHCHPREYRPGDVVICAIQSSIGNTAAVLLPNNQILVHLVGQLSTVVSWGGMFRNNCVAVYRHKDVPPPPEGELFDVRDLLPDHIRKRLAEQADA
jgi:cell wall-associated NlpC family hydrolase